MSERRKISISFSESQFNDLVNIMEIDGQDNYTFYFAYLVNQEKKRKQNALEPKKRSVGRPKKQSEVVDDNKYPAPYSGGGIYTRDEWISYFEFRNEPVRQLPKPLTAEEIEKYQ